MAQIIIFAHHSAANIIPCLLVPKSFLYDEFVAKLICSDSFFCTIDQKKRCSNKFKYILIKISFTPLC